MALDYYQDKPKVWHVSGWAYPIDHSDLGDTFLSRVMNCWGWATWADRWQSFEKNPQKLTRELSSRQKFDFDLEGTGVFWSQVERNLAGELNTWAVFWYATIFKNDGLCLSPTQTYVHNIGHDGSGTNCGNAENVEPRILNTSTTPSFEQSLIESSLTVERIKDYYRYLKIPLWARLINKLSRLLIKKNLIN